MLCFGPLCRQMQNTQTKRAYETNDRADIYHFSSNCCLLYKTKKLHCKKNYYNQVTFSNLVYDILNTTIIFFIVMYKIFAILLA
jgi:hypothetical protein